MVNNSHCKEIEEILRHWNDKTQVHNESMVLEYKGSFNYGGLSDYYRDFAAFANNKGGFLIYGVKDKPKCELVGLSEKAFKFCKELDPESVDGHLLEDFSGHIDWEFNMIEFEGKYYAYFYVTEAEVKPIICKRKIGDMNESDIYFRYTGRTQRIRYTELEEIIRHRLEQQDQRWKETLTKLMKTGPTNAAILDMENNTLSASDAPVMVVDEKLVERIKFIKEGQFDEKEGAPTLKLVGQVTPINKVEVVKREKWDPLKEYTLSAKELAKQVKDKSGIKENLIWLAIKQLGLKENKEYAYYNFRSKKQADDYIRTGKVPNGVPSIYKPAAVDLIIKTIQDGL